jgi:hypothetical protein
MHTSNGYRPPFSLRLPSNTPLRPSDREPLIAAAAVAPRFLAASDDAVSDQLRFHDLHNLPVTCRAWLMRLCVFKLAAGSLLCLVMANATTNSRDTTLGLAFTAATCAIAAAHYVWILNVRAQRPFSVYQRSALTMGEPDSREDVLRKAAAQEVRVETLRFTDWTATCAAARSTARATAL